MEELTPGRQPWEKELRSVRHAKVRDVFKKKYLGRCFVDDFSERKVVLVDWAACTEMNNGIAQWVLVSELVTLEIEHGTQQRTHPVAKHAVVAAIRAKRKRLQIISVD